MTSGDVASDTSWSLMGRDGAEARRISAKDFVVESAFLVAHADGSVDGELLPPAVWELLGERAPRGLIFEPLSALRWRADSAPLAVGMWSEAAASDLPRWAVGDDGNLGAVVGTIRQTGQSWAPRATWPRLAMESLAGLQESAANFEGVFAALGLDTDGNGLVRADALGFRHLYYGSNDGLFCVGTRAELVAAALCRPGQSPIKDVDAVIRLAHTGLPGEGRSGFEGVSLLSPGGSVVFTAGNRAQVLSPHGPPWAQVWPDSVLSTEEAADLAEEEIYHSLLGIEQAFPGDCFFDLTGGKDSRLVAAVAARRLGTEGLRFRTFGVPGQPDVELAERVAAALGLTWDSGVFVEVLRERWTAEQRFRGFVSATAGSCNAWNIVNPPWTRQPWVRVSGLNGECLRSHRRITRDLRGNSDLLALRKGQLRAGSLKLVRSDFRREIEEELDCALVEDPFGLSNPRDRLESFDIRNRARARYGPLDEVSGLGCIARVLPLYSTGAIAAAFAQGSNQRAQERIHQEIIRRASPEALASTLAGAQWDGTAEVRPPAASIGAKSGSQTFMAAVREDELAERVQVLRSLFEDGENVVWERLDRRRALDALDSYPSLTGKARQEIFGAATAAAWLHPSFLDS